MRSALLLVATLGGLAAIAAAAPPAPVNDPFLERLVGSWVLRGTLAGKATTHDVDVAWLLDGLYVELHERSREKNPDGKPRYEAIVLLGVDPKTSEYQCLWLDSTGGGGLTPGAFGRGPRAGDAVPFSFHNPDGTISFSNTFSYDRTSDSWSWQLENVRQDGTRSPFGNVLLTRHEQGGEKRRSNR